MKPTRRSVLTAGGVSLLAPLLLRDAFADRAILGWHDRALGEYTKLHDAAFEDGYRLLSLDLYGPPSAPLYATVTIKRAAPSEQRHFPAS